MIDMEKTAEDLLCESAIAGDLKNLEILLSKGADPSFFDSNGLTPLMHATLNNQTDCILILLSAGAPWNALSPSNLSAGDLAMQNSHQESFDILLDFAIRAELILGTIFRCSGESKFLNERVLVGEDRIMDLESKAVMMAWEKPLMEAHARAICGSGEDCGRILNVGFGMGIVDEGIERYGPMEHVIVEAHGDVYDRMMELGWGEKENVKIVFGKWQDVVGQIGSFDGIFFDTYGEYYEDVREFHQHLPRLLKPGGIYSYFNGFCGNNAFFHIVYCQLVALELEKLGFSTMFIPLPVKDCLAEDIWEGVKHKYWQLDTYNLPVCQAFNDSD